MRSASALLSASALVARAAAVGVWTTPHDSYSSSIGVLGCKVDTNRIAYWPGTVDCNNLCVKLSYGGRSVHLLRVDQSGGAYDVSYDAWAYLQTGQPASQNPIAGGTVAMEYEEVDASQCASLIHTEGGKLPLSASNSINFLASCLAQPNSWVAKNHVLYNICDPICTLGFDEVCTLDLAVSNQPSCAHTLGLTSKLNTAPVVDVKYQTGKSVKAGSGEEVSPPANQGGAPVYPVEQPSAPSYTPAAQPTPGVFHEYESSVAPVPTKQPAAPVYPTATYSPPETTDLLPTGYNSLPPPPPSYTPSPVPGKVYSTMSVVTVHGTGSHTVVPSTKPTTVVVSAGPVTAHVPAALIAGMILFSILGAF